MLWHLLKYLLAFSIPSFYRKIQIKNVSYLKNKKPAVIVSNHPNAFMDPIAFSYMVYPPRVRYMARGDAFKPGIITAILQSIGIIPIFRIQDAGISGVKKNNESYKIVYKQLQNNKKVMVFAEGICVQEKRLRPIKKGVPRLIFNAQQELSDKEILVIPVCLNYSKPSQIGSTLFINVGEPFTIKDRINEYIQNPNAVMLQMMDELYQKMLPLTIHIQNPVNDEIFEKTREILDTPLCYQKNFSTNNLEHIFIVEKEISEVINKAFEKYPNEFLIFADNVSKVYQFITKYNVHIPEILSHQNTNKIKVFIKILLHIPVFIIYTLLYRIITAFMFIPYFISKKLAEKVSTSVEFYASFFLAFSTFIFLFYYLVLFFILKTYFNPFIVLIFFAFSLAFIPLIHYYPVYIKKLSTLLKILNSRTFVLNLSKNIQQILNDYEYLKNLCDKK